jgi:hypothetical protein
MVEFPRVAVLDGASWTSSVRDLVAARGYRPASGLDADVVVIAPGTDLPSTAVDAVRGGLGLVVLATDANEGDPLAAAVAGLLGRAGIQLETPAADGSEPGPTIGTCAATDETAAVTDLDLLARVDPSALSGTRPLQVQDPAAALLRTVDHRGFRGEPVAAVADMEQGRIVVLAISGTGAEELLMSAITYAAGHLHRNRATVRSDATEHPAWQRLKASVTGLQALQASDGSVPDIEQHGAAARHVRYIVESITELIPSYRHDADYLSALVKDFTRWGENGFTVPDFLDSLVLFHPERQRVDGREHLVVFPMYTQNGSPDRHMEAVLVQTIWPGFVAELESGKYSNKLFVPIRFLDFTAGYDTNSAVLFPETVAMREVPKFTWGAIFADREAARFRSVVTAAAEITHLALPPDAARLLEDQKLAEETFVMWDLIHDRTHMHGDLPFDPFMIKQRMPFFLYSLEELRCDLTAFAEAVALERQGGHPHARLVQYAVLFDRIFRFAITGSRVKNYDGLGGQLLFAWLHQHRVVNWTDNRLSIEWDRVADSVMELGEQINDLYWRSIDRPKVCHWLAAYELISATVTPHPASVWAKGADALPVSGPPRGLTDAVLPDEFPLSMFHEALSRKLSPVVTATRGITG